MNEHEFLKITGGIDEGLAAEYGALTPRKRISAKRGVQIAVGVAAAAALAIPAGAYAYNTFIHKDNVEFYLSNSDRLEAQDGYAVNYVMENEHLTKTIDVKLSDGHNVMMIITNEAKDLTGELIVDSGMIRRSSLLSYADGTPGPYEHSSILGDVPLINAGYSYIYSDNREDLGTRSVSIYNCDGIDIDKEMRISYFATDNMEVTDDIAYRDYFPEESRHYFNYDGEITNLLEGFDYVTSFAPNVDCVTLHSENGDEIFMSEFEVYAENGELIWNSEMHNRFDDFYFILNDGEKRPLDLMNNRLFGGTNFMIYGEFIDLDDYAGVEICGVEYLK